MKISIIGLTAAGLLSASTASAQPSGRNVQPGAGPANIQVSPAAAQRARELDRRIREPRPADIPASERNRRRDETVRSYLTLTYTGAVPIFDIASLPLVYSLETQPVGGALSVFGAEWTYIRPGNPVGGGWADTQADDMEIWLELPPSATGLYLVECWFLGMDQLSWSLNRSYTPVASGSVGPSSGSRPMFTVNVGEGPARSIVISPSRSPTATYFFRRFEKCELTKVTT